jgi:hypothetical protein
MEELFIESATLRPDQVARLAELHCKVTLMDEENEIYSVFLPEYAEVTMSMVQKGGLVTTRHQAVIPLDPPSPKEAAPTMFKRVVWTDTRPAKVVGMTIVEQ